MTQHGADADPTEKVSLNPQPLPPRWLAWLPARLLRVFGYAPKR